MVRLMCYENFRNQYLYFQVEVRVAWSAVEDSLGVVRVFFVYFSNFMIEQVGFIVIVLVFFILYVKGSRVQGINLVKVYIYCCCFCYFKYR